MKSKYLGAWISIILGLCGIGFQEFHDSEGLDFKKQKAPGVWISGKQKQPGGFHRYQGIQSSGSLDFGKSRSPMPQNSHDSDVS